MGTDKDVYYTGETVYISGEIYNGSATADSVTLSVTADGAEVFNDTYLLESGETQGYSFSVEAVDTFILQASAGSATVYDQIEIVPHGLILEIIAPDTAGLGPFDAVLTVENQSNNDYIIDVSFAGSTWENLQLLAGGSQALVSSVSITEDATIMAIISGPLNLTETKTIVMGESATLEVNPAESYAPGTMQVPFTATNTGLLDVQFEAAFTLDTQTITRTFFLAQSTTLVDDVSFELGPGEYTLIYNSPYGSGSIEIIIEGGPEFKMTVLPDNLMLSPGLATWNFTLENTGIIGGLVDFYLMMPDWEESQLEWLEAGEEKIFSFEFEIPDDLEAEDYTAYYKINDGEYTLVFSVAGPKVEVEATLDKNLYEEGETAILTLDVTNVSTLDLGLFAIVNLGDSETMEEFSLTAGGTDTLQFNVPVDFDSGKLLYGIYMVAGRALHLNALYVNEKHTLGLWTDKQVYDIGETVTINMDAPQAGIVSLEAPGYSDQINLSAGVNTTTFAVPELRQGTYYIEYTFDSDTERYPFDVRGYAGRITSFELDQGSYQPGENISFTAVAEVNLAAEALLSCQVLDHWSSAIDNFEMPVTLTSGVNTISGSTIFNTSTAGLHSIQCRIQADVSGPAFMLASAQQYFDAAGIDSEPIANAGSPYFATEGTVVIFNASNSYDLNNGLLEYRWDFNSDGIWDTDWVSDPSGYYKWSDDWRGTATLSVSNGILSAQDTVLVDVANMPPSVYASALPLSVKTGEVVYFSGSFTDYGIEDTHTILWNFGDGNTAAGDIYPSHSYTSSGTYTVSLTVTDDDGGVETKTLMITVTGSSGGSTGGGGSIPIHNALIIEGFVPLTFTLLIDSGGYIINGSVQLTTPDGKATITIPNGARLLNSQGSALTSFSAGIPDSPPSPSSDNVLISVYTFGPAGATFNPSLTLIMKYDTSTFPADVAEEHLFMTYFDGTQWKELISTVDTDAKTVTVAMAGTGTYAIIGTAVSSPTTTPPVPDPPTTQTPTTTPLVPDP
ncbi:MAG: PKD domain-containing protein, partial [Dehalococcoidales bacterium]|nr:PKD domain-containing protein [Dehalococcoidales bacterium]